MFEYFLVGDCVFVANDKKFFLILNKKFNIFSEQTKWRVTYYNIGFLEVFDTFGTIEVSVACEFYLERVLDVDFSVPVYI